VTNEA